MNGLDSLKRCTDYLVAFCIAIRLWRAIQPVHGRALYNCARIEESRTHVVLVRFVGPDIHAQEDEFIVAGKEGLAESMKEYLVCRFA
jgi:hypothetical protein